MAASNRVTDLLKQINNASVIHDNELALLQEAYNKLACTSKKFAFSVVIHNTVESLRVEAEKQKTACEEKLAAAKKEAEDFIASKKYSLDAYRTMPTFNNKKERRQGLEDIANHIDSIYMQYSMEIEDYFVPNDLSAVSDALVKSEKPASDDFHTAIDKLFDRAESILYQNHATGFYVASLLIGIGVGLIAAACPPVGTVMLGLLIGGSVLTAGGVGTLFYKAYQYINDPYRQVAVKLRDEENKVIDEIRALPVLG